MPPANSPSRSWCWIKGRGEVGREGGREGGREREGVGKESGGDGEERWERKRVKRERDRRKCGVKVGEEMFPSG